MATKKSREKVRGRRLSRAGQYKQIASRAFEGAFKRMSQVGPDDAVQELLLEWLAAMRAELDRISAAFEPRVGGASSSAGGLRTVTIENVVWAECPAWRRHFEAVGRRQRT